MDGRVDDITSRLEGKLGSTLIHDLPCSVDLDKVAGSHLCEVKSVRVNQEVVLFTRYSAGDMPVDKIVPAEVVG